MALSSEMRQISKDLILKFGSDIKLKKPSSSVYDISSGETVVTPGTETIYKSVIESYSSDEIKGLIQSGDIKMMLADNSVDISISDDKIVFNNIEYNIINVEPLILQNEVITINLQVRK